MNNNDIFASSRPVTNEKPESDPNDIFFSSRPKKVQEQFKVKNPFETKPVSKEQYDNMSMSEKLQYGKDLEKEQRFNFSRGFTKGLAGDLSFGASENVEWLAPEKGDDAVASIGGALAGSLPSIGIINKGINYGLKPAIKYAPKVMKYAKGAITAFGTGASLEAGKQGVNAISGNEVDLSKIPEHGAEWVAIDLALGLLGKGGQLAKWIYNKSKGSNKQSMAVVNDLLTDMKKSGIDISDTDRATSFVLSEFEKDASKVVTKPKPIKLSTQKPSSIVEDVSQETLELKPKKAMGSINDPLSESVIQIPKEKPKDIKLSKKAEPSVLETKARESLPKNEVSTIDLKNKKIEKVEYEKVSKNSSNLSEPYMPNEIDAQSSINRMNETRTKALIENVSERAGTKKQLGESVKADIESGIKADKAIYEPLYEEVKEGSKKITHKPTSTIALSERILSDINALKTKSEGSSKVISTLNNALEDMGLHIKEYRGVNGFFDSNGNKLNIGSFRFNEDIALSKTIELAKRLNSISGYDVLDPSIKNVLKLVVGDLKNEIKTVLKKQNSNLFNKYMSAEEAFAKSANKFRKDSVRNIRGSEKSEQILDKIIQPSILEDIKNTVTPARFKQVEREVVESLNEMSFEQANKAYREISHLLSKKANDASRSIISSKSPFGKVVPLKNTHESIITDLTKAFNQSTRPENVLNLWKTPKGQSIIKDAIEGTPNKKEILNYLKEQSFYDFTKSVVDKSGKINFKKFNEYLKDPATLANLKLVGGDEAVKFFYDLEQMSNVLKFNISTLEKLPTVKLNPTKGTYARGEEALLRSAEKANEPYKKALELKEKIPNLKTDGSQYGKEKLKIAGERARTHTKEVGLFKETYPKKQAEQSTQRGKQALETAARNRQPYKFQFEDFIEKYNISPTVQGVLYTLGLLKLAPATVAVTVGKVLYQIASKPSTRSKFRMLLNTSKKQKDKIFIMNPFLKALNDLSDELPDE